ncbi:MAG: ABC transporter permease [bacterium]|nr:ABC transporter permease [bacterium]MDT8395041.1 ABC transporter permease [bacterium]
MSRKQRTLTGYILALGTILALWQAAAWVLSTQSLPGPLSVAVSFFSQITGRLAGHFLVSGYRVLVSLVLALGTAVPFGIAMGRIKGADRLLSPFVYLLYPIPKIALLPLILLLFGIGDGSKIFLISFILFFQILVATRDAAREIPREHILSMRSLGAGRRQKAIHLVLPAILPKVLTSLRIGIGTSIAVLFFVESFATSKGLGFFILDAWSRLDYESMYAGIVGMGLLGVILYELVEVLDRKLCGWTKI